MKPDKFLVSQSLFNQNSFLKIVIFTLFSALFLLTSCQDEIVELNFNLEEGKTYHLKIDGKSTFSDRDMSFSSEVSYLVKAVHDSYYDMEVKYEMLSTDVPSYGKMGYSSDKNDDEDFLSMILAELINKTFSVKMGKNGEVIEANINESLFANIFDKFPELSEMQKSLMEIQLKGQYSEEAFKGNIENATKIFPAKPLTKGDKWIIKGQSGAGSSLNIETTYELKEIARSYYKIFGQADIKSADKESYIETSGTPTRSDVTGSLTSEITIDKKSGWIIKGKIIYEFNGDLYMKSSEKTDESKFPMNSRSEIVIKGR